MPPSKSWVGTLRTRNEVGVARSFDSNPRESDHALVHVNPGDSFKGWLKSHPGPQGLAIASLVSMATVTP